MAAVSNQGRQVPSKGKALPIDGKVLLVVTALALLGLLVWTVLLPRGHSQIAFSPDDPSLAIVAGFPCAKEQPYIATQPIEETTLELDLSEGREPYTLTMIVPANELLSLTNGGIRTARALNVGDGIYVNDRHGVVQNVETKLYTPRPPSKPDQHGRVYSRVIGKIAHEVNTVLYLSTQNETITTTSSHPFLIAEQGWVEAGKLQRGDRIQTQSGTFITVDRIESRNEKAMVYNLVVEGTHTFYVGNDQLLVHNCTPDFAKYTPGPNTGFSGVYDPTTGKILVRPSGNTRLADGSTPTDLVDQYGGHGELNNQIAQMGANTDKTLGFVLIYNSPGQLQIRWNSGSVNTPNYNSRAVPAQFRQQLINTVESSTGLKVIE